MHPRLQSAYGAAAFFAHAFVASAQHGFSRAGYMEPIYRDLFLREIGRLGIEDRFYPVGGAANHSLLYLIARLLAECRIPKALEFGCGQTTVLMHEIRKRTGTPGSLLSVEHNPFWADHIAEVTGGEVRKAELHSRRVQERECRAYDIASLDMGERFNLFLVDGPEGAMRRSRWGALEVVEKLLDDQFVVIFDDAGRIGEVDTIRACRSLLRQGGRTFSEKVFSAGTNQHVFFTEDYRSIFTF